MNRMTSSTPICSWYANCRGSSTGATDGLSQWSCLSRVFIMWEVSAAGLFLFISAADSTLGTRIRHGVFHRIGTLPVNGLMLKILWRGSASWLAQYISSFEHMHSGPATFPWLNFWRPPNLIQFEGQGMDWQEDKDQGCEMGREKRAQWVQCQTCCKTGWTCWPYPHHCLCLLL